MGALGLVLTLGACATPANAPEAQPAPTPTPTPEPEVTAEPENISVTGAVALGPGAVLHDFPVAGQCSGHSEFTDIDGGIQVQILDSAGAVVAVTELEDGSRYGDTDDCVWTFQTEVPVGGGFYSAKVLGWESDKVAEADLPFTIVPVLPAG